MEFPRLSIILEWVAIPFSRGSSQPRGRPPRAQAGWGLGPQAPGCREGWAEQGRQRKRVLGSRDRQARTYLWPGDGGSCLRMGNSGSLSTPCSCFSLYSFCRSTSWCRSRSLGGRPGGHPEAPWGRPLPKISHDPQFAARTRLRAARGCSTDRHQERAGPCPGPEKDRGLVMLC